MKCPKPRGVPEPKITWKKADNTLLKDNKFSVDGCCTLRKNRTKRFDTGNYTCIAENLFGTKSDTIEIIVSGELNLFTSAYIFFYYLKHKHDKKNVFF